MKKHTIKNNITLQCYYSCEDTVVMYAAYTLEPDACVHVFGYVQPNMFSWTKHFPLSVSRSEWWLGISYRENVPLVSLLLQKVLGSSSKLLDSSSSYNSQHNWNSYIFLIDEMQFVRTEHLYPPPSLALACFSTLTLKPGSRLSCQTLPIPKILSIGTVSSTS